MRLRDFLIKAWQASLEGIKQDLKHVSLFLFFSFSFSPVLYKLTDTIATDTIHTTAGIMLFVHLMFHNYGIYILQVFVYILQLLIYILQAWKKPPSSQTP